MTHRSGGRQGKAALAGTKDYGRAHREYVLALRAIYAKHGILDRMPAYLVEQLDLIEKGAI